MSSIMSCASKEGACWTLSISSLLSCCHIWVVFLDPHTHGFSGYSSLLSHNNFSYTPLAVHKKRAATSGSHKQPNAPACSSTTRRTEIRREFSWCCCLHVTRANAVRGCSSGYQVDCEFMVLVISGNCHHLLKIRKTLNAFLAGSERIKHHFVSRVTKSSPSTQFYS